MALRNLEITVISGEDLRLNGCRLLDDKNAFATVRTGLDSRSTCPDRDGGGSYPYWNHKLSMALPASEDTVSVEVYCKKGSAVRSVGAARVPVSDFDVGPVGHLHILSYRLKEETPDGTRNGIINLSVKKVGKEGWRKEARPAMAKQARGKEKEKGDNGGAVVMGHPIGKAYGQTYIH